MTGVGLIPSKFVPKAVKMLFLFHPLTLVQLLPAATILIKLANKWWIMCWRPKERKQNDREQLWSRS